MNQTVAMLVFAHLPWAGVSGIEDSILRKPVLSLEGGGSTVEEINRAKVGVSHLGLAVKWCKGFWLSQRGGGARDVHSRRSQARPSPTSSL